jgi:hypothetical protein
MNKQETAAVLRVLRAFWQDVKVTDDLLMGWTWAFEDVSYPVAEDAAKRWIKTQKWFPKPAELLEIIGVQSVAPNLIPEAAWAEVLKEARRVGGNRLPLYQGGKIIPPPTREFSHPAIEQAVEAVGWKAICLTPEEERSYLQHRFTETLKALIKRDVRNVQIGENLTPLGDGSPPVLAIDGGRKGEVA